MPRIPYWLYFNENAPYPAQWLRNLYPHGDVDMRGIEEIQPEDIIRYRRVHLFAGIGGWQYALHLAGWPSNRPVWTGSCPCQPFSVAGRRRGNTDKRHLWPYMRKLIEECRPATIFGEQVASKAGREWLSRVRIDLEALGYAVGCADLCAAGVGSPQIRQRLFWVGHSKFTRLEGHNWHGAARRTAQSPRSDTATGGSGHWSRFEVFECSDGRRRIQPGALPLAHGIPSRVGRLCAYGNAIVPQIAAEFIAAFMEAENMGGSECR